MSRAPKNVPGFGYGRPMPWVDMTGGPSLRELEPVNWHPDAACSGSTNWAWFNDIVQAATANGLDGMVEDDVTAMAPWGFDLTQITAPTLIMHGRDDRMVPSSHGEWIAAHCPAAELRLQPGAGHISLLDSAPQALAWLRHVVTAWPAPESSVDVTP